MTITALPVPPLRSDPNSFAVRADAFLAALPVFVTEANEVAVAMNLNATTDTSVSSVLIGTGAKTFTVTSGKSFQPGMYLVIANTAAPSTNSMFGQVTSYSGTSLVMNVISVRGSGTLAAWTISQASAGGAAAGANTDITSLSGLTTALSVAQGGTGSTTAANARTALGAAASGANTDITSLGNVTNINGGQLAGMRNKITNGKMEIAQRGTSFPSFGSGSYSLDRYLWQNTSAGVITISQQADAPADNEFQSSLRVAVTTADASVADGDISVLSHRIEGYNVRDLIGRTFTLSFRVRSSKTGVHCVAFKNEGLNRPYVLEYTVNAANTWETKTVTVSGGLITSGAWNWTNGTGLIVAWSLVAGSNFQTNAGAWQTGDFYATANQVNCLDTVGNIFAITGVQLEVGPVATPFEHRPYGMELALCQRYYEVTRVSAGQYNAGAGNTCAVSVPFKVTKRAAPSVGSSLFLIISNVGSAAYDSISTDGARYVVTASGAGVNASTVDVFVSSEL